MTKLGIGFVGAGWMGQALLRQLISRDDTEIVALHQRDEARAADVLAAMGLSRGIYIARYEDVLANPRVHAVFLCSPNAMHGPQAIAALEGGKHVFCEKPCATHHADFQRQLELERLNPHLITYVDYILYFDSMEQRLRHMVGQGMFGELTQVQINYRHPVDVSGQKAWKLTRATMGDAIGMGIVHALSVMHWIMAANGTAPVSVFATSAQARVCAFEAHPIWNVQVSYDNGATGFAFGNIDNGNGYDAYHSLYGTQGAFVFDSGQERPQKVRYWSSRHAGGKWIWPLDPEKCHNVETRQYGWDDKTTTPDSGNVIYHQTAEVVEHFVSCVKTGQRSPLSFANSAAVAAVGWAALLSAQTGAPVSLPLGPAAAQALG